jgi:nitroreductase
MLKKLVFVICALVIGIKANASEIKKLPEVNKTSELMKIIDQRASARVYSNKAISDETLSEILWSAFGVNSHNTRTIPTAMNEQNLKVFVVYNNSIWQYDGMVNTLVKVSDEDIMEYIAKQDFVRNAPLNLIYTGSDKNFSTFHAGAAAQNVSLYAISKGLKSIVRGYIDKEELKDKLRLDRDEFVIINQVIGYPEI